MSRWVFATMLIVLACALVAPATAGALTVDSTADDVDANLGDAICASSEGECTLRAAIEEANETPDESEEISFAEGVFDGQLDSTIHLDSSLTVEDNGFINGRECATAAGIGGPCVGIDGPSGEPALVVDNIEEVEIWGLAITGAPVGVSVDGSPRFKAQASWFGVTLDGEDGGNGIGIYIGPGSNSVLIGSEGAERGNVIAGNDEDGVAIHGARNARVFGNYFGIAKDGATHLANDEDIEVTSAPTEGLEATGTAIGTKVGPEAAASPQCDGGCNLIGGGASGGIDLQGDGGLEGPAAATTILGNQIGLDTAGLVSIPNDSPGIRVGEAPQTIVGGRKAGEPNRINGGSVGVLAEPAAADLVVSGNLIGFDPGGSGTLAPPGEGIYVNSEALSNPTVEAVIADNEIRMDGGVAIAQRGFGARIADNEVIGAETGIRTFEFTAEHGNLIEGNSLTGLGTSGILIENDLNEVVGNEIAGAGGAGIWIQGSLLFFGVSGNLVGGDVAKEENVITGSGGAAIEIANPEETANEVARNRGFANSGLFIDLVAADPDAEKPPNYGIAPPVFSGATQTSASGGSAIPGANVRVFSKQTAAAGELQGFLGEATADASGNWEVAYGGAIPVGTIVAATQTSEARTSELATATTAGVSAESGSGGGSGGEFSGPADRIPPETKILSAPRERSQSASARFKFAADEPGSTFQCKLDEKPFRACRSPKAYGGLKPGGHVFRVRAVDPSGNLDPKPAKRKFTVLAEPGGRAESKGGSER
jgi:CSLREA domain-containing protein